MILYHFTKPEALPSIVGNGLLRPTLEAYEEHGQPHWDTLGANVRAIWLTADREHTPEQRAWSLAHNEPIPERGFRDGFDFRLKVRIGSHDRKLAHYLTWCAKHNPSSPFYASGIDDPIIKNWWLYLGDIPLDRLSPDMPLPAIAA